MGALALLGGCSMFVRADDGDAGDSVGTTSGGESSDESSPSNSSAGSGAGTTGSATTVDPSGTTTSSADPTSDSDEDSSGESSSSTGSTSTQSCWGSDEPWELEDLDILSLPGVNITSPSLSADGLTLYYAAGPSGQRRPYQSVRDDRSESFADGEGLDGWTNDPVDLAQLRLTISGRRLLARVGQRLHVAELRGAQWTTLQPVEFGPGFEQVTDPALDAAGDSLLFVRAEVYDDEGEAINIWAPYSATWAMGDAAPSDPEPLQLPGMQPLHAQLCPALSPDGQHLILGGSFPETWLTGDSGDLDVFESERMGGQWSEPQRVPSLSSEIQNVCPMSITDDGCEATFRHFDTPFMGNTYVLARREPA